MRSIFMTLVITAICSTGFGATCDIFQRTEASNYSEVQSGRTVQVGENIFSNNTRLYVLQKDSMGNLYIMGLKLPLGSIGQDCGGCDPTYVGAVGSSSSVGLIDYAANISINCHE